jgi:hypothetical protein
MMLAGSINKDTIKVTRKKEATGKEEEEKLHSDL